MKKIETIQGVKYEVGIYFETSFLTGKLFYKVIPTNRNTTYPVTRLIKGFESREAADHYARQF